MPAAAVISAPSVYMNVAAVKKLIVGLLYIDFWFLLILFIIRDVKVLISFIIILMYVLYVIDSFLFRFIYWF